MLSLTAPGDEKPLAARRSQDSSPAFSPDGKSVAFISTSDGHPEIYFMNTDGTGLVRVTHSTDEKAGPQFSVDGALNPSSLITDPESLILESLILESPIGESRIVKSLTFESRIAESSRRRRTRSFGIRGFDDAGFEDDRFRISDE